MGKKRQILLVVAVIFIVYILVQIGESVVDRKKDDIIFQNANLCGAFGIRYHTDAPADDVELLRIVWPVSYWEEPLFGERVTVPKDFSIKPYFDLVLSSLTMQDAVPELQGSSREIAVVFYLCEEPPPKDIPTFFYCGAYHIPWFDGAFYAVDNVEMLTAVLDELKMAEYPVLSRSPLYNEDVYELTIPDP